jgi:peptide deformylase
MALRQIIYLPDPVLRRKAQPVDRFDSSLQTLIDDMIETMRDAPGVGLAAPQVGVSDRIIVVEYPEDEEKEDAPKKLFVVITRRSRIFLMKPSWVWRAACQYPVIRAKWNDPWQ